VPGHRNGGVQGALVSHSKVLVKLILTLCPGQLSSGCQSNQKATRGPSKCWCAIDGDHSAQKFKDGLTFRASDSFVQLWLHSAMGWSQRKGTHAAQKLPDDWEDQCEKLAL
jgi:hypothetical protein